MKKCRVAIIMGSDSDWEIMKEAAQALDQFKLTYVAKVISAHRTPQEMFEFAKGARKEGIAVIIAGAGGAAHLPGMVAAITELPVIGVPVPLNRLGSLQGIDALLSIVQMPKGVPVATVAIGGSFNAGILAAQIVGASDPSTLDLIADYKKSLRDSVLKKKLNSPSKKRR